MADYSKILKFNPNHDSRGRFSSNKGHIQPGASTEYLKGLLAQGKDSVVSAFKVGDQRYKIEYRPHSLEGTNIIRDYPEVRVSTMDGFTVAEAQFVRRNAKTRPDGMLDMSTGDIVAHSTNVHADHRRKGIATTMYEFAEMMSGKKILPDVIQTDDGKAFSKSRTGG